MEDIHYTFRMLALSQIIFLCAYHILYQRNPLGLLVAATSFSFACYMIMPFVTELFGNGLLYQAGAIISNSIPAILWLLAKRFFDDDETIPPGFWIFWFTYMFLWIPWWIELGVIANQAINAFLFDLLPQAIKLGFVLHVVYKALDGRTSDLVTRRLNLRVPIAAGAGLLASVIILVEIWVTGTMPLPIEIAGSMLLFLITLAANTYLFRLRSDLQWGSVHKSSSSATITNQRENQADSQADIQRITNAMTEGRFYASHGATISDLSEQLSIPAYRLRTIINQQLKFRNFNQFLNHYRIEEVSLRLMKETSLPILTLALDVGFKSISSFNKAFKDIHGKTPSDYRFAQEPD